VSQTPDEPAAEENGGLPQHRPGGTTPPYPPDKVNGREERLTASVVRTGMFGATTSGDTSGYGRLQVHKQPLRATEPPYGGYFDAVAEALDGALQADGIGFSDAIERVVVDRGEITFHVRRDKLVDVADKLLHDPALRFEICTGVSGVHYPDEIGRELHAVYHMLSITHNRRIRLEVSAPDADPHIPSLTGVYPANNWHERETWDFFGIVFDGHPALTRIEMPDDWRGHPQRKDYPLGGIPVEYRGTKVPPPDERRSYS
jgi:NADH-quinone oxidoreductase subunit C